MDQSKTIVLYLPTLNAIAYNLVRCKADAEDIVQDSILKWLTMETKKVANVKAYLTQIVKNKSINHLIALRRKKVSPLESINTLESVSLSKKINFAYLDKEEELLRGFKILTTKLKPLERAVFLLKKVFDLDYDALQKVLHKKKDHCRQLLCRAHKKLRDNTVKIYFDFYEPQKLLISFKEICLSAINTNSITTLTQNILVPKAGKE